MRKRLRPSPSLEMLESRWVPATIRFTNGSLFISNPNIVGGATSLTVTQVTPNTFQVKDNAADNGTFGGVSNINISGTNAADTVNVDFAGSAYSGSLTINASNGNDTTNLKAAGGQISGNLTIMLGRGNDTLSLNRTGSAGKFTVAGTTQITAGSGLGTGNNKLMEGNGTATTTFLGNVNVTGINNVLISFGQPDVFRGDLNVNVGANPNPLDLEATGFNSNPTLPMPPPNNGAKPAAPLSVLGNFNVTGGPGDDQFQTGALNVGKNINVNLQGGSATFGNFAGISASYSGVTTVSGSYLYNSTAVVDIVDLAGGQILGDATIHMGQGGLTTTTASGVALDQPSPLFPTNIGGNLTETGGNGDFTSDPFGLGAGTGDIHATIGGNATFNFGNGDNSITLAGGFEPSSLGGTFNYTAGNGSNTIGAQGPQLYQLNVQVGNGNNTFNSAVGSSLSGLLKGGSGNNAFNQNGATIVSPFTEINFAP